MRSKTRKIPEQSRVYRTLRIARRFIRLENIKHLPVDPFEIANRNNWGPVTVGEVYRQSGIAPRNVINGKDADALYVNGKYKIVYNEKISSNERKKWTIMHEIGHIVLGHLSQFDETRISRGNLTEEEYNVLEREADIFAAEVLAPLVILEEIGASSENDIVDVCKISRQAARNRENDIKWHGFKKIYIESMPFFLNQFKSYLTLVSVCRPPDIFPFVNLIKNHSERRGIMQSKYDFMRLNENGRFEMCPRCGNANISEDANYCKICGFWLFNNCNNQSDNTYKDYCGRINDGDARYCEHCGSETFLMNQGLLKTWEELLEQYDSVNKVIDQAAASLPRQNQNIESIDIPDDELPF